MNKYAVLLCILLAHCAQAPEPTVVDAPELMQQKALNTTDPIPHSFEPDHDIEQGPEGTYKEHIITFMLRPNPAGDWRFLNEGNHQQHPYVREVLTYHDRLEVFFNHSFTQVYGFGCMVDAQLALSDITCGLSGGIGRVIVYFKQVGIQGAMDPTTVPNDFTNITIILHGYDNI